MVQGGPVVCPEDGLWSVQPGFPVGHSHAGLVTLSPFLHSWLVFPHQQNGNNNYSSLRGVVGGLSGY